MRLLYLCLGWLMVGVGIVGAFLPVLPTTPFLLLAAWAFARSSPRLEAWLLSHRILGPPLRDWREHGAINRRAKVTACLLMAASYAAFWFGRHPSALPAILVAAVMLGSATFIVTRPDGRRWTAPLSPSADDRYRRRQEIEPMMRLPLPLNALRAFEAVARHLGIKEAALELGVTPSAISHQIRQLEDGLGVELLRRSGQRLELTPAGQALSPDLTESFSKITTAVGRLKGQHTSGPLRMSVLPTFAVQWLSPRLASYPFEKPGYELLISTTQEPVELGTGANDAAIRHGRGEWPGLIAEPLFTESDALLGAPLLLLKDEAALRQRLSRTNLFISRHRRPNFARWNETLPGGPITPASVVTVDSAGLGLRAAIDGAGVTLAGVEMAAFDLAAGRLATMFDHRITHDRGYYLVFPPALARDRRLRNVRTWLSAQIAASGLGDGREPLQRQLCSPSQ